MHNMSLQKLHLHLCHDIVTYGYNAFLLASWIIGEMQMISAKADLTLITLEKYIPFWMS